MTTRMQTRQRPRVNYAEPTYGESPINTSDEKEYNSESTETDGPILSQDRKFVETEGYSADPDAAYVVRSAPVTFQYSDCYSSDNSDVTFIEKRKTEKKVS